MSEPITPEEAAAANAASRQALLELGVSEPLVEKAEGVAAWLREKQSQLESAYSHCPCYRVDVEKGELAVGDVLLDEWRATIVSALGTWIPEEAAFYLAPHDPSCPPEMCEALKEVLANDACLRDIPESQGGSVADISEEHVWLLTGVMAMALEADGIHVAANDGRLVFLAIRSLRRVPDQDRQLNERRAAQLVLQTALPVGEIFRQLNALLNSQVEEQDPAFVESVLPEMLQETTVSLERLVNEFEMCGNHSRMADSPISAIFEGLAERYQTQLDKIDEHAKQKQFDHAFSALAEAGVMLDADLAAHSKIAG